MAKSVRNIKARITLLTSKEGGRSTPANSGYRPQFCYDRQHWDAAIELIEQEQISPGESAEVYFQFTKPEIHRKKLHQGKKFQLKEGATTIANGVVLEIIN